MITNRVLLQKLADRKVALWLTLKNFADLLDAHGVHDMAVEIQGIEIMERMLKQHEFAPIPRKAPIKE